MTKTYTKKELKLIKDFLANYDLGMYYPDEMFTIAKKALEDLGEALNNSRQDITSIKKAGGNRVEGQISQTSYPADSSTSTCSLMGKPRKEKGENGI